MMMMIMMIIIMSVFLERLSMWNVLNCGEQVQIQKYKTHAYTTLKATGVQTIMRKRPTEQLENTHKTQIPCQRTHK